MFKYAPAAVPAAIGFAHLAVAHDPASADRCMQCVLFSVALFHLAQHGTHVAWALVAPAMLYILGGLVCERATPHLERTFLA